MITRLLKIQLLKKGPINHRPINYTGVGPDMANIALTALLLYSHFSRYSETDIFGHSSFFFFSFYKSIKRPKKKKFWSFRFVGPLFSWHPHHHRQQRWTWQLSTVWGADMGVVTPQSQPASTCVASELLSVSSNSQNSLFIFSIQFFAHSFSNGRLIAQICHKKFTCFILEARYCEKQRKMMKGRISCEALPEDAGAFVKTHWIAGFTSAVVGNVLSYFHDSCCGVWMEWTSNLWNMLLWMIFLVIQMNSRHSWNS